MIVLAVGAHPDDVELGCGGTLAKHAAEGDEVHIVVMASLPGGADDADRMEKARAQAEASARILGAHELKMFDGKDQRLDLASRLDLTRWIEKEIAYCRPEIVYTHHTFDRNLDHRITHDAVLTACRPTPAASVKRLLSFEVPSSTELGSGFWPTSYVEMTGDALSRKFKALREYGAEMREFPHPRSVPGLMSLMTWRGSSVGVALAEAFMLVREIR